MYNWTSLRQTKQTEHCHEGPKLAFLHTDQLLPSTCKSQQDSNWWRKLGFETHVAGVDRLSANATDCSTTVPDRWAQQSAGENYTESSVITFNACHVSCCWRITSRPVRWAGHVARLTHVRLIVLYRPCNVGLKSRVQSLDNSGE